ncbi:MAG: T9SS C-terminal target domain-containing protein [Cryomorphaceae bacterium]|nr:MAG: T9SS C-terminal target domain-containing protein [Cryomorphaceae bacterium]
MKTLRSFFLAAVMLLGALEVALAQPFCNQAQTTAGFSSAPECAAAVCADDPFCCETAWDAACASGSMAYDECIVCRQFCTNATGEPGYPSLNACQIAVCNIDNFCCETSWDGVCAGIAAGQAECEPCAQPFCNEAQSFAGFALAPACEAAICGDDPFCCISSWDGFCAGSALDEPACFPCFSPGTPQPPCPLELPSVPSEAVNEDEPCGFDFNGGCDGGTAFFEEITCNQTLIGTAWADGGERDTDWYLFNTTDLGSVSVFVEAQFPSEVLVYELFEGCPVGAPTLSSSTDAYCDFSGVLLNLQAGTHAIVVRPSVTSGYPCGSGLNNYVLTVTGNVCGAQFCNFSYGFAGFPADLDCQEAVCLADAFCCFGSWDGLCAAEALDQSACEGCLAYCNNNLGVPGFPIDLDCQEAICSSDPFCCDTSWDGLCAGLALETPACINCLSPGTPPPPCGLELPEVPNEAVPEGETCGADTNGGCNMATPTFKTVACGQTIVGSAWADGGTRDTDWYILTTTIAGDVMLNLDAEFPALLGVILDFEVADCPFITDFDEFTTSEYCSSTSLTVNLPVGNHIIFVAPNVFNDYPCDGGNNNYVLSIEGDLCETTFCNLAYGFAGFPADSPCQQAVCATDPFCCNTAWDGFCAGSTWVIEECADCLMHCNETYGIVGFPASQDCEDAVCDFDSFCCTTEWDGICAGVALDMPECEFCLSALPPSCGPLTIPADATPEGEVCGTATNNGCWGDPVQFGSVGCSESIHGSAFAALGESDIDVFAFELTAAASVTVTGMSEFEAVFAILEVSDCENVEEVVFQAVDECEMVEMMSDLDPGSYAVYIQPMVFNGISCDSDKTDYYFTLDIDGPDCDPTSVEEISQASLSVYPNPSRGQFVVELPGVTGTGVMRVVDITGRPIIHRDVFLNGDFRTDVELNVARGTYVLQIITPEGAFTRTLEVM